jgi:hypothetical protein
VDVVVEEDEHHPMPPGFYLVNNEWGLPIYSGVLTIGYAPWTANALLQSICLIFELLIGILQAS